MADKEPGDPGALWTEFHRVVNMTSDELGAWLRTSSAGEKAEELPENSGTERGRRVLAVLKKRQVDLTDADIALMREVVDVVRRENEHGRASGPDESEWRHRLMTLGHDPVRP